MGRGRTSRSLDARASHGLFERISRQQNIAREISARLDARRRRTNRRRTPKKERQFSNGRQRRFGKRRPLNLWARPEFNQVDRIHRMAEMVLANQSNIILLILSLPPGFVVSRFSSS